MSKWEEFDHYYKKKEEEKELKNISYLLFFVAIAANIVIAVVAIVGQSPIPWGVWAIGTLLLAGLWSLAFFCYRCSRHCRRQAEKIKRICGHPEWE